MLDATGAGLTSDVIDAIDFAVANRRLLDIDVINLSLGHPIYEPAASDPLVRAVERAVAAGIVVVTSAGNFGGIRRPASRGTPASRLRGTRRRPSRSARSTRSKPAPAATIRSPGTARAVRRGTTVPEARLVAPGSRLVSDLSVPSTLASTYPGGVVMVGNKPFIRLSGTSMAAGVVSGVVALMLDANRSTHRGWTTLPPNAVKAILEYTSFAMPGYDALTEGAGALNAAGAVALAAGIDPGAGAGSWWLDSGVTPATAIDGATLAWSQRVVWGDRVAWAIRSTRTIRRGRSASSGAAGSSGAIGSSGATARCGVRPNRPGRRASSGAAAWSARPMASASSARPGRLGRRLADRLSGAIPPARLWCRCPLVWGQLEIQQPGADAEMKADRRRRDASGECVAEPAGRDARAWRRKLPCSWATA